MDQKPPSQSSTPTPDWQPASPPEAPKPASPQPTIAVPTEAAQMQSPPPLEIVPLSKVQEPPTTPIKQTQPTTTLPAVTTPPTQQLQQTLKPELPLSTKQDSAKQHKTYSETVYNSRFTQFRILRIVSIVIGVMIIGLLSFGLWRLYSTVFHTIENTEQLFQTNNIRRTDLIDFGTLERVRATYADKYNTSSSTPQIIVPIFGVPPITTSTLDNTSTIVEE